MTDIVTIHLNGPRIVTCAACHQEIKDERVAVSIDDCGEPTREDTGYCRSVCRAFHDLLYTGRGTMSECPAVNR